MPPKLPQRTIQVTTYETLTEFISQFVAGHYSLLVAIGAAGLSKSRTVKRTVGNRRHLYAECHLTAFGLYQALYEHRDELVIIDDIDEIYRDPRAIRLLKALCNTDARKRVRWASGHPLIGDRPGQVPEEFDTSSPVCLIANDWKTVSENVKALEDRGIILHFAPSPGELHVRVREWFDDQVVYDFIEEHLPYVTEPSMRHYVLGKQLRQARPDDWQQLLLQTMGVDRRVRQIAGLLRDPGYSTDRQRVEAFKAMGLGDRATYYRWKKRLDV